MISINIIEKDSHIIGLISKGHANYDIYGEDIVCAAVSAIVQTAVNGVIKLNSLSEKDFSLIIDEGFLKFKLEKKLDENKLRDINLIFETMKLGLEAIKLEYPKNITLNKEVE